MPVVRERIRRLTEVLSEVRFMASDELLEKLDEIRGLLAHSHPNLSMAELIDVLATNYREQHHPEERARRARDRRERRLAKKHGKSKTPYLSKKVESPTAPWAHEANQSESPGQRENEAPHTPTATRVKQDAEIRIESRAPTPSQVYALIERDGYQCSYVDDKTGQRCASQFGLEIHHQEDWALGGETKLSNLSYVCVQHHRRISFLQWGENTQYIRSGPR